MRIRLVVAALCVSCLHCRNTPVYAPDCQRVSEQAMAVCFERSVAEREHHDDNCYEVGHSAQIICGAKVYEQTNVADCLDPLWLVGSSRTGVINSCKIAWGVYCDSALAQAVHADIPCDMIKATLDTAQASHANGPGWPGENRFFSVPETPSH